MTHGATGGWAILFLFLERHRREPTAGLAARSGRVETDDIDVLVMRETYAEFRNELASFLKWILNVAKAGKEPAARVTRTVGDMAVRADYRRGSFTREKLRAMAIQTGGVLGKIAGVGERCIAGAHFLPVLRGNCVTGAACQFLCDNVSLMRELRVIDPRLFWRRGFPLRPALLWLVAGLRSGGDRHKRRCQKQQKHREGESNRSLIAELH